MIYVLKNDLVDGISYIIHECIQGNLCVAELYDINPAESWFEEIISSTDCVIELVTGFQTALRY